MLSFINLLQCFKGYSHQSLMSILHSLSHHFGLLLYIKDMLRTLSALLPILLS